MYSQKNDVVLDPFAGLGTTMRAAMLNRRNSIGYDIDDKLGGIINNDINSINLDAFNGLIKERFDSHKNFIRDRESQKKDVKHFNKNFNCKVMTGQEEDISFEYIKTINRIEGKDLSFEVEYIEETDIEELPFLSKGTLF